VRRGLTRQLVGDVAVGLAGVVVSVGCGQPDGTADPDDADPLGGSVLEVALSVGLAVGVSEPGFEGGSVIGPADGGHAEIGLVDGVPGRDGAGVDERPIVGRALGVGAGFTGGAPGPVVPGALLPVGLSDVGMISPGWPVA